VQGVALSAARLKIDAVIVMPVATPAIKVAAVRKHGGAFAKVLLHGENYDEAAAEAKRLVASEGRVMVHPFDDPLVIAGQGTIGQEILRDMVGKPLDAIFCCVGGGGLIAGVAAYVKRVRPEVKVIGVEADDAAAMTASLKAGRRLALDTVGLFADGAAVKNVGEATFAVAQACVDEMVTVSNDEICAAIKDTFNDTRSVLEPAGALALAGCKRYIAEGKLRGRTFACITSGANMDFDRLRFVSERADSSETLMAVTVPERPGSFRELYQQVFPRNVTEFSYRYAGSKGADIFMSFQARGSDRKDAASVIEALRSRGYRVLDLTDNEMAKVHARHLAGGRSPNVVNEHLYRFEFPERPGALNKFLEALSPRWNVSLFHYRNHGHDIGRVLTGIQVAPEEEQEFARFLQELGYASHNENANPVYQMFLK
jgi:threonine dehydratase